jgi:release factor glutamine methyltransferase
MLISAAIAELAKRFSAAGIASAQADAEILLAHILETSRGELQALAHTDHEIERELFEDLASRREKREPLQHITGVAPFRSLLLEVGPGVFIPRFETEMVAQLGIDYLNSLPTPGRAVDVGTGSGAIAISLALETGAQVHAIELSGEAFEFASRNIRKHGVEVELIQGDFQSELVRFRDLDLLISNPPYIPLDAVPVDAEVRDYDPELALYSGPEGLDAIVELVSLGELVLRSGGMMVLEHADGQSDAVRELLLSGGWRGVSVHPDAVGRLRAVSAIRK